MRRTIRLLIAADPTSLETMRRIHLLQQGFGYSDPAMEDALHDRPLLRDFARLDASEDVILTKARLVEQSLLLREGTIIDATLMVAPSSTKNRERKRDREMSSTKKGNHSHDGLKAHIGIVKRQFGYTKVRYRGLFKNAQQLYFVCII